MRIKKDDFKTKLKKAGSIFAKGFLIIYTSALMMLSAADYFIPDTRSVFEEKGTVISASGTQNGVSAYSRAYFLGKIPVKTVNVDVISDIKLIPCGNVFGVKFFTKGVLVINLAEIDTKDGKMCPAKKCGVRVGDIIINVDSNPVNTVEQLADAIEQSRGNQVNLDIERDGEMISVTLVPKLCLSDKKYKTGLWVRDSTAGIGTMTYYNPKTGFFAGLGHGICDVDTGALMPLLKASVVDVEVTDIIKGRKGIPGELKGSFDITRKGALSLNTSRGIYGVLDKKPEEVSGQPLSIALKDEICEGQATILCELDENGVKEYTAQISKIDKKSADGKNFVVTITDEKLLSKTGGIVQGMSGSPIIQNGKIIGAVTHVLVNDPTKGYGIFIENMLSETDE